MNTEYRSTNIQIELTSLADSIVYVINTSSSNSASRGAFTSLTIEKSLSNPVGTFSIRCRNQRITAFTKSLVSSSVVEEIRPESMIEQIRNIYNNSVEVSWREIAIPQSLVKIYIDDELIMIGLISECYKEETIGTDGKPDIEIVIDGEDLAKLLVRNSIFYDMYDYPDKNISPFVGRLNPYFTWIKDGMEFKQQSLDPNKKVIAKDILLNVIDYLFTKPMNQAKFNFADGSSINDYLDFETLVSKSMNANYPMSFPVYGSQGSLWNAMRLIVNLPFNEMFMDTGKRIVSLSEGESKEIVNPNKYYLIVRPTPFDFDLYNNESNDDLLPADIVLNALIAKKNKELEMQGKPVSQTAGVDYFKTKDISNHRFSELARICLEKGNIISKKDIISRKLGVNDHEVYSAFYINSAVAAFVYGDTKAWGLYKYIPSLLRRYGYSAMTRDLNNIQEDQINTTGKTKYTIASTPGLAFIKQMLFKLTNWMRFNVYHSKGEITIYGNAKYRIGDAVFLDVDDDNDRRWYYIEKVRQTVVYNQSFLTILTTTRGVPLKGFNGEMNLPDPKYPNLQKNALDYESRKSYT